MDFQALFDAVSEAARTTRKDYHLTLDKLIAVIENLTDQSIAVVLDYDPEVSVGSTDSYRGYYADMALQPSRTQISADKLYVILKLAHGSTFEGYKGGDFEMEGDTPLWVAAYGSTGRALMGASEVDGRLVLHTKELG